MTPFKGYGVIDARAASVGSRRLARSKSAPTEKTAARAIAARRTQAARDNTVPAGAMLNMGAAPGRTKIVYGEFVVDAGRGHVVEVKP